MITKKLGYTRIHYSSTFTGMGPEKTAEVAHAVYRIFQAVGMPVLGNYHELGPSHGVIKCTRGIVAPPRCLAHPAPPPLDGSRARMADPDLCILHRGDRNCLTVIQPFSKQPHGLTLTHTIAQTAKQLHTKQRGRPRLNTRPHGFYGHRIILPAQLLNCRY